LNEVIKVLTALTVVFMPLMVIPSIYGMNFKYMPELDWRYGYPATIGVMVGIVVVMLWFFRRKKWI
jgi:magnesium transporter